MYSLQNNNIHVFVTVVILFIAVYLKVLNTKYSLEIKFELMY